MENITQNINEAINAATTYAHQHPFNVAVGFVAIAVALMIARVYAIATK